MVLWCEILKKPQLVNLKWLCQFGFFWFVFFLNSHSQILSWCLQFTTTLYPASCCCYVGKWQTLQKALCFHDTDNSNLGINPFFLSELRFTWAIAAGSSGPCSVMQSLRAKKCDFTSVWPRSDSNSARIFLTLGDFCLMLHRCFSGGEVFHQNYFCTSVPLFLVLWFAIFTYTVFLFLHNFGNIFT